MDKREFVMSIARDLAVEIIKSDKHLFEIIARSTDDKAKEQATIISTLFSALVDGVASAYDGIKTDTSLPQL